MKKYAIKTPINDEHFGTYWQKIGYATEQEDGSIRCRIFALPIHRPLSVELVLFESKPKKKEPAVDDYDEEAFQSGTF